MDDEPQLYGPPLAAVLSSLTEALQHHAGGIGNRFFDGLTRLSGSMQILSAPSEPELRHLKSQQLQDLYALAAPDLTAMDHRAMALRQGVSTPHWGWTATTSCAAGKSFPPRFRRRSIRPCTAKRSQC
jgi:hypothetical protein